MKAAKKEVKKEEPQGAEALKEIATKDDLKVFFLNILNKVEEDVAAPIYALSAINYALNLPNVYDVLDRENKELARELWMRIKQRGVHVEDPPMLFPEETDGAVK